MSDNTFIRLLFQDNGNFQSYGNEHWIALIIGTLIGIGLIFYSKTQLNEKSQRKIGLWVSGVMCVLQLCKVVYRSYFGILDIQKDLPFHLCNFLPFLLFAMYYFRNEKIWKAVFIWVIAGTAQANFTPSLTESFPHFEAIRYWTNHIGLVVMALFPVFVWGWKLEFKDIFTSLFWLNVTAGIVILINLITQGNYMYLMHKPPFKTMYDYMGPHPYYILVIEFIFIGLATLVWLPFRFSKASSREEELL